MTTPEHDPMNDVFDEYARATAAETRPRSMDQLRRKAAHRRIGHAAVAGVATAVLAVPAGWALQQAGAADAPPGAAGEGTASEEEPPCVEDGGYAILAEGVTVEDYLAAESMDGGTILSHYESIEEFAADPDLFRTAELAEMSTPEEIAAWVEGAEAFQAELGTEVIVVKFYGTFEEGGTVEVLYPCDEAPVEPPTEEGGTPGGEPAESDESEPGTEPSEGGQEPTEGDEATPTWEEPTTGADEPSPTGDEEPTEQATP